MENNERLKQIVSNLQILTDLTNSMTDSEMYPVSFFSQAFDLIQKIQADIHTLEANQVEMFATQMKKHQALILSIHQQMRNIVPEKEQQVQKPAPPIIEDSIKVPVKEAEVNKPVTEKEITEAVTEPSEEVPAAEKISVPANKPAAKPAIPVSEVPAQTEKPTEEPVKQPDEPITKVSTQTVKPIEGPIIHPSNPEPDTTETVENAITPPPPSVVNAPRSVNDLIEKKKLSDLRKAFSLNDRFLYRRELFGGSEEAMNKVIAILNNKVSFSESVAFLEEKLHWDFSSPTVKSFVKILEIRFL